MKVKLCVILLALVMAAGHSQTVVVNFSDFTVGMHEKYKVPEWVTYRITKEMIEAPRQGDRGNYYSEPGSLKTTDYSRSGYDRGHMAPYAALNYDSLSAAQTFSMYNVIPQTPFINRGVWQDIETYEGKLAIEKGCLLIHIKNVFDGTRKNRLYIPEYQIKTLYGCDFTPLGEFKIYNIK